jgi:hypothetical protein
MTLEQAVEYALDDDSGAAPSSQPDLPAEPPDRPPRPAPSSS